jgi:hypothetical protein
VTNGAAIVPRHVGADGNGFESFLGRCHVYAPQLHDLEFCSPGRSQRIGQFMATARHGASKDKETRCITRRPQHC